MLYFLLSRILAVLSALLLLAFIFFLVAWFRERKNLQRLALSVVSQKCVEFEKLKNLNSWVYRNKGFAKNPRYFFWKRLGPTPSQILEQGGDCADKSRLLSAMLSEIGLSSTLAMMYSSQDGEPVHTIVFTRTTEGLLASDPVYDLTFGSADNPVTVQMLVADSSLMLADLRRARAMRPSDDKIHFYDEATHHFDFVTTINWRKNDLFRGIAKFLALFGIDARFLFRPRILEDPLLFLSIGSIFFAISAFAGYLIFLE